EEVRVKIKDLNEHIVCCLCAGYFVDATTITECLHTFCKSCIVKYLQTSKYCPMCNIKIHETQPLLNLKLDRVMQDIVYKLVPGLQDSEEKRIREFYQSRGLDRVTQPSGEEPALSNLGLPFSSFDHSKAHYYRYDEQLSLCLERLSSGKDKNKSVLQNKYVRCSVRAEVRHLRRVLCHRLMLNPQHVQLLFDNEVLPDHMTMKQIWLSRWFGKPSPLLLQYSVKEKRRRRASLCWCSLSELPKESSRGPYICKTLKAPLAPENRQVDSEYHCTNAGQPWVQPESQQSPLTCTCFPMASPVFPVTIALPGQVLPSFKSPSPQHRANNFQPSDLFNSVPQGWGGTRGPGQETEVLTR
ncbi:hypothetical protein E2I00_009010, partial [Balaenoptera physalus]